MLIEVRIILLTLCFIIFGKVIVISNLIKLKVQLNLLLV